jgi:shikimate dehydrogenase
MSQPLDAFRLAGVMGYPALHSRSPRIHNYWFERHRLAGAYLPLELPPDRLEAALRALPALGFSGCNLTIPHKVAAMALVDEAEDSARRIGAINCVVVRPDGRLIGRNYDGFGFVESLFEAAPGFRPGDGPVLALGAGGGARAVVAGLQDAGAKRIMVTNRSPHRAQALARDLGVDCVPWEDRAAAVGEAALLVNTTSLGMAGQPALEIDLSRLAPRALVADIVYVPRETDLLRVAREKGCRTVNGLGMLLHQARPAFRDWFGVMPQVTPQLRAMIEATL